MKQTTQNITNNGNIVLTYINEPEDLISVRLIHKFFNNNPFKQNIDDTFFDQPTKRNDSVEIENFCSILQKFSGNFDNAFPILTGLTINDDEQIVPDITVTVPIPVQKIDDENYKKLSYWSTYLSNIDNGYNNENFGNTHTIELLSPILINNVGKHVELSGKPLNNREARNFTLMYHYLGYSLTSYIEMRKGESLEQETEEFLIRLDNLAYETFQAGVYLTFEEMLRISFIESGYERYMNLKKQLGYTNSDFVDKLVGVGYNTIGEIEEALETLPEEWLEQILMKDDNDN